jgi:hypothetical protein
MEPWIGHNTLAETVGEFVGKATFNAVDGEYIHGASAPFLLFCFLEVDLSIYIHPGSRTIGYQHPSRLHMGMDRARPRYCYFEMAGVR